MYPLAIAKDWKEVRCIEKESSEGRYSIVPEAEILKNVIVDGWTGEAMRRTFGETKGVVETIIGADDDAVSHPINPKDCNVLRTVCLAWLSSATLEPHWWTEQKYRAKLKCLGYDVEEAIWDDV